MNSAVSCVAAWEFLRHAFNPLWSGRRPLPASTRADGEREASRIEFVQPVLSEAQELLRGRVRSDQRLELVMLLFSQCCRSSDHLIQVLDGVLQFLDVLLGSGDAFLGVGDGGFSVGDVPLQPFLLIVSVIELLAAILLLAVIVDLTCAKGMNKAQPR